MTVPPAIVVRSVYKRIALSKHCTLRRLENGKTALTGHTVAGTFVNGVKVKFLYTVTVKDGDVISLISVEESQASHFTLASLPVLQAMSVMLLMGKNGYFFFVVLSLFVYVFAIFWRALTYTGIFYVCVRVFVCVFFLVWAMEMDWLVDGSRATHASYQMRNKLSNADHC